MSEQKWLYRYDADYRTYTDEADPDYLISHGPYLTIRAFKVKKNTPKGFWVSVGQSEIYKRWVPKNAKAPFARPTKKQALEDYIMRKRRFVRLSEKLLKRARKELNAGLVEKGAPGNEHLY